MYWFCFNELYFVVRVIDKFTPDPCSSFSERNDACAARLAHESSCRPVYQLACTDPSAVVIFFSKYFVQLVDNLRPYWSSFAPVFALESKQVFLVNCLLQICREAGFEMICNSWGSQLNCVAVLRKPVLN